MCSYLHEHPAVGMKMLKLNLPKITQNKNRFGLQGEGVGQDKYRVLKVTSGLYVGNTKALFIDLVLWVLFERDSNWQWSIILKQLLFFLLCTQHLRTAAEMHLNQNKAANQNA